ncbi:MAG TPA: ATP-binding cassette domain-containing protein [Gaiellaceae bacterium]|nr:ATP-binding cassette domain-containing protein [Gaiellaceae bacterium]
MSRDPLAVIESVSKTYTTATGVVDALRTVDATVPRGGITAVTGVSGSGKSTLLRLLAGHDTPTTGRLLVDGRAIDALGDRELRRFRRDGVAYVAQRAADNFFAELMLSEHVPDGAPVDAFDALGLGGRLGSRAAELSGGELARAAFALALARGVSLIVVDEPTAELDRENAAAVIAALQSATAHGATFVIATHDPEVTAIADHVIDLTQRVDHRPTPLAPRSEHNDDVVLSATGLSRSYGGLRAVSDVSIEVRAGQLAVIVGRSGSGKSTLLMLLGGWSEPDAGTIGGMSSRAWSDCAYVPQRFGLVPELTVAENVELPARGRAEGGDELLARLALDDLRARYPAEISIGQQQRVAVARALVLRPRLLLVDEPTSHQDRRSAELVWSALSDAAAAGTACLVATHEPDARVRADVSWAIEGGIVARG